MNPLSWMLPRGTSTFTGEIDWIYYVILAITGAAFVIVEVALVWFLVKYRHRPGRRALYMHGNNRAEYVWTGITAAVVVMVGLMSAPAWGRIKGRESAPPGSLPLRVLAKQFEWHVTYPGPDRTLDTPDDFTMRGQLHVPEDQPVKIELTAEDVIHSLFVPSFRIKQDAVPGMEIPMWFQATERGEFELACAELCGLGHYRMKARVTVHARDEYERWLAETSRERAAAPATP